MKNVILPILGATLLFASCKETAPAIDFGPKAADTSFTAAPEAPDARIVVIEEFTGVTCPQCPKGHVLIKSIEDANANPDRIAAMGIQVFNFAQCNPVDESTIKTIHD